MSIGESIYELFQSSPITQSNHHHISQVPLLPSFLYQTSQNRGPGKARTLNRCPRLMWYNVSSFYRNSKASASRKRAGWLQGCGNDYQSLSATPACWFSWVWDEAIYALGSQRPERRYSKDTRWGTGLLFTAIVTSCKIKLYSFAVSPIKSLYPC